MLIDVTCDICGNCFQRNKSEVARNAKLGRKTFCSRACMGKSQIEKNRRLDHLNRGFNRSDDLSMFRVFMHRLKKHGKEVDVTLDDLKAQWDKQAGKCPYTGWSLWSPNNTNDARQIRPDAASLDRIDSAKGYIKGNIEFVCLIAQYAKNGFAKEHVLSFAEAVVSQQKH